MSLTKVAVVLGVGSGLGAAIAHRFAQEGFVVVLMARRKEKLIPIQKEIEDKGGKALSFSVDALLPESIATAFSEVRQQVGNPEVLVYNVGDFQKSGILDASPEQFENSWKANCFGAFLAVQQVLPAMVEQRQGTILLTGATAALRGLAQFSSFAVGKAGLRMLSQSLAREFGPLGIHVAHIVIDGQINTPKFQSTSFHRAAQELLAPRAIAETYWQLYRQDATAWTLELDLRPAVETF